MTGYLFFTKPPRIGVSAVFTTIEEINATGILTAIADGGSHVVVFPHKWDGSTMDGSGR